MARSKLAASVLLCAALACGGESREAETPAPSEASSAAESGAAERGAAVPSDPEASETPESPDSADLADSQETEPLSTLAAQQAQLNGLLEQFRTEDGFRYAALAEDEVARAQLDALVQAIAARGAAPATTRDERLAFFINAYNTLTIAAVVAEWPITSVMNVDGFFDAQEHTIGGESMTLNALENDIIRGEEFDEARIHFAVNCASLSCPPLRSTAYDASSLDAALEAQTAAFIESNTEFRGRRVVVSQLFEWFEADFDPPGVTEFIAARLEGDAAAAVRNGRLSYATYDWAVNAASE